MHPFASYRRRTTIIAYFSVLSAALAVPGSIAYPDLARAQTKSSTAAPYVSPYPQHPGPLMAVVSIGNQSVTLFDRTGAIAQSPISSGRSGYETPQGVFSIIEKKEEHFSNIYDDASMPFMQRITWSGVAFHAGVVPGYPASHGCIRLPANFAERFFGMSRLNMRVVVVPGVTAPRPIAHPALFQPATGFETTTIAVSSTVPEKPSRSVPPQASMLNEDGSPTGPPMMLGARLAKPLPPETSAPALRPEKAIVTPLELAKAKKISLNLQAAEALKALDSAKLLHKVKLTELEGARRTIGAAEFAQRRAGQRVADLDRQISRARTEDQIVRANVAYMQAVAELEAATKVATETRTVLVVRGAEVGAAAASLKTLEKARLAAVAEARAADRLAEPVSVLVSRRTGKLYIRQARNPVAEFPVTITNRDQSIGTHIFTAMESPDGGHTVNWNVISLQAPQGSAIAESEYVEPKPVKRGRTTIVPEPTRVQTVPSDQLGAAALERIQFPPEALARITPYLQVGSSLIISDLAPSIETGPGTDFVVQTRGEEEAVEFITRYARENNLKPPKRPE